MKLKLTIYLNIVNWKRSFKTAEMISNKYNLSSRSYTKLLKMARTIADLEERDLINSQCIIEAFHLERLIIVILNSF